MSGPAATRLLLTIWVPAILSATCNPKRADDAKPPETGSPPLVDATPIQPEQAGTSQTPGFEGCPVAQAAAGPLGPQVGPVCPGSPMKLDDELLAALDDATTELGSVLKPVTPAFGARLTPQLLAVGSATLQGPPHCYTLITACTDGAVSKVELTAADTTSGYEGPGPLQICPPCTATYTIDLSVKDGQAACAMRILGD